MIPNKFQIPGLAFSENATTEVRIPKGLLLQGLVLSGSYTDTLSVAATSAKTRGVPIKNVSIIADGGKVLMSARPQDLIREAEIFEQTALAAIAAPPTAVAIGAQTGTFDIPLFFAEPFANDGMVSALPTWLYDEIVLRVDWGGHSQLYVGGTGVVSIAAGQSIQLTGLGVQDDFNKLGDPYVWGRRLSRALRSYKEVAAPGAANTQFTIELPRTADVRSLVIVAEDANGVPVDTIINSATLELDNSVRLYNQVPYRMLRAENAKVFGVAMPPGVAILEFAEDRDISDILQATKLSALNLILDVNNPAGTIRVYQKRFESSAS
jgi:hypothetical protein